MSFTRKSVKDFENHNVINFDMDKNFRRLYIYIYIYIYTQIVDVVEIQQISNWDKKICSFYCIENAFIIDSRVIPLKDQQIKKGEIITKVFQKILQKRK